MFKEKDIVTLGYIEDKSGIKEVRMIVNKVFNTDPITYEFGFMGDVVNEKGEYTKIAPFVLPHMHSMKLSSKQLHQ